MQWRGQWAQGTEYQPDDVVGVSGSAWVCISPSQGNAPEDSPGHWEMLASRGRGAEFLEDLLNIDPSERGPGSVLVWNHSRQLWEASPLTSGEPIEGQPFYYDGEKGRLFVRYDSTWVDASPAVPGIQGIQGEVGPQGPQGIQGTQGIQGPQGNVGQQGVPGPAGPAIEVRSSGGYLQQRPVGSETWTNIIPLSEIQAATHNHTGVVIAMAIVFG